MNKNNDSLESVLAECVPWSEETFPQATSKSVTVHLFREWKELCESNFTDQSEYADVVMLLAHLAYKKGFDLAQAVRDKFEVNKTRKWGKVDEDGVVEHVREERQGPGHVQHVSHNYMKVGPDGRPYGIGNTGKPDPVSGDSFAPPVQPTYRAIIKEGMVVFEKMVYRNLNDKEHRWKEMTLLGRGQTDNLVCQELQKLADMGFVLPIEVSANINVDGRLIEPVLNERWEQVTAIEGGKATGKIGRVRRWRKSGKEYASEVEWDNDIVRG